jgi:hypothetical protein
MDDITTQPYIDPMPAPPVTPQYAPSFHHKKRAVVIAIIVLVILIAAIAYYVWEKRHTDSIATPVQTLNDLRLSSAPDKETITQKSTTMAALEKSSTKPSVDTQQQLQILDTLSK